MNKLSLVLPEKYKEKTVFSCMQLTFIEKKNWRKELYHFLLNYRATRHTTTKFAPAGLLFNREMNTKLPTTLSTKILRSTNRQVRENDEKET
jgi:hypothetical protein